MRVHGEPFVVHEDASLLVVHKPSGLPTTSMGEGACLVRWVQGATGVSLHPTSRLDAPVTGLVTFAKTKAANAALLAARRVGAYRRGYLALAARAPADDRGAWDRAIGIDPKNRRLRVALDPEARGQRKQRARTTFAVLGRAGDAAALWLTPHTGRTHQLRVHAADAGCPLLGDHAYGGPRRVALADGSVLRAARVMLHCAWLSLPGADGDLALSAPAPDDLRTLWRGLGGEPAALVRPG